MSLSNKNKEVIVLCPNGRRVTIRISPSTSIGQIVEEACLKQKYDSQSYNLKHLRRVLDPSSTFQYANIPNHAQLELIEAQERREEQLVTVNLVTDTGQRLISNFPSNSTLWDILLHHDQDAESSFQLPPDTNNIEPFIVYTMRKIGGRELKTVTLKSLGLYSGRCAMRYNVQTLSSESNDSSPIVIVNSAVEHPKPSSVPSENQKSNDVITRMEEPLEAKVTESSTAENPPEDMECESNADRSSAPVPSLPAQSEAPPPSVKPKQPQYFSRENDAESKKARSNDSLPVKPASVYERPNSCLENNSERTADDPVETKIIPLSDHDSLLFNLDDAPQTLPTEESDHFFELSLDEVRGMFYENVKQLKELEEAPLMTQQLRQLEKDSRLLSAMNRHPVTQLRICFPDRHVIQANFKPRNTIQEVIDFLRPLLIRKDLNFYLYTTFPRKVLEPNATLVEAGCIPKARLYFGSEEGGSNFLSEETLEKKSSFEGASKAVITSNKNLVAEKFENSSYISTHGATAGQSAQSLPEVYQERKPNYSTSQQKPKWFKLGK